MLAVAVKERLAAHLLTVKRSHERDLLRGEGRVVLPFALDRKYPGAPTEWGWQFVFPASRICRDPKCGTELWTRQFGSSLIDSANAVSAVPTGDVYVAGSVGAALLGQTFASGTGDAFLRKYDRDGNEIWTRKFGTSLFDQVRAVSADAAGRVYVGGDVGATLPGQTSAGSTDAFVRKYDRDGNEVWTIQLGSPQRDSIGGVAVHESGEVVAVGDTDGALPGQTSAGDVDGFVVKTVEVHRP